MGEAQVVYLTIEGTVSTVTASLAGDLALPTDAPDYVGTYDVTYNLTNGASANVTPTKVLADEGFSVRLTVPAGYNLSDVCVTMGGIDITDTAFDGD